MLNSGLCEPSAHGFDVLLSARTASLAQRLGGPGRPHDEPQDLEKACRDFASLFYSTLVRQMQRTVREEEDQGPVTQGAWDFFGLFLPRALASNPDDALSRYIQEQISSRFGEGLDETG
ncbi:MAG: hypothetical protein PVJ27_11260 [Candidatus Brocadiaceae bacterium]|jgi:hypothetical protein